jgi:hypothetical protein
MKRAKAIAREGVKRRRAPALFSIARARVEKIARVDQQRALADARQVSSN